MDLLLAAEKWQLKNATTKMLAEIFCIFECLLTQNPTNQGSQLF